MPTAATMILSLSIATGTIIAMSSHHWLTAWLGLELNTLAILPVISKTKHPRAIEAATKYFLAQAVASCLLLSSSIINAWQTGTWDILQMTDKYAATIMLIALAMKAGAVPLHFWLPEVMQGSTMYTAMLISTWQKLAPMTLLYSMSSHVQPSTTLVLGLLSTTIGGWGGINQTQLRKMMAYSSITNLGWALMVISLEPNIFVINILMYILMMIPTFPMLAATSTNTLQTLSTSWTTSPLGTTMLMGLLLSIAGLPPLTGFLPKLLILNELVTQALTPIAAITAMTSMLNLVFYLRATYMTALLNSPGSATASMKWRSPITKTSSALLSPTAISSTPALPSITP
nr:NADH-ubiquinone oxidoreductase chain 2 [Draco walkeri]WGN91208.1 NADH-ubiquinone oxidoreductase chain 2 [Draco walkeri]WGN91210.1 NADH-ubiquinone oxidoreductase chain 2 [Draco walkeri]WGN91212.1 NADH-ubiquinone oxidoreductase chain 2 [Draco walkeri]WGN91218.1 NADH-ubiquinone oxidoreductase chain 2 [Draco walkeri]